VVGPINTAGQAYHWARAVDSRADLAAMSTVVDTLGGFRFVAHRVVPRQRAVHSRDWQRAEFEAVVTQATHVLIESAQPLFGPLFRRNIVREVRALQRKGVRVAIVAHGSDVRDVRAHRAREPLSPYAIHDLVPTSAALAESAQRTRTLLRRLGVPLFGSTPGVLFDLPTAIWLPVVVDPDEWITGRAPLQGEVPVVVHAPSNAGLKGSEVADRVLGRLHREGLIEYRRLEGVSHAALRDALRAADIVVDSLRMGGYGVGACEAMAAGRLVLSYVNTHARMTVEALVGEQPPIWPADADSLEAAVRAVLADRAGARALAARGSAFVRLAHDGRASAAALESFLDS
jgi:glycosyltransferase involved in cell wall biosynthesis